MERKEIALEAVFLAIALMLFHGAYAVSGTIKDTSGNLRDLLFTGTPTNPGTLYKDAQDPNPDVLAEICGVGPKYVMVGYGARYDNGTVVFVGVSYSSATQSMAYAGTPGFTSGCYRVANGGEFVISPSYMALTPFTHKAAFPGYLWMMYSDTATGSNAGYVLLENSGRLLGSYSFPSGYYRSGFVRATNEIVFPAEIGIVFQSASGPFTKTITDSSFGPSLTDYRYLVLAVCTDNIGKNCSSIKVARDASEFPVYLPSGVAPIDDQHSYARYAVINGIGSLVCIGPEIAVSITTDKQEVYWSDSITATITVKNVGNVEITTPFTLRLYLEDSAHRVFKTWSFTVNGLAVDEQKSYSATWDAYNHSGTYYFVAAADESNTIKEWEDEATGACAVYGRSNTAPKSFTLKDVTIVSIWINESIVAGWIHDGTYTPFGYNSLSFPKAGIPYNLTFHFASSDEFYEPNPVPRIGVKVFLQENNGMVPFVPIQVWNSTLNGANKTFYTKLTATAELLTDDNGNVSVTVIPTGNKFFLQQYRNYGIADLLGNYTIVMYAQYQGQPLTFVTAPRTFELYLNFTLKNFEYTTALKKGTYLNAPSYIRAVITWIAQLAANIWRVVR